jgi:hypothetical protein
MSFKRWQMASANDAARSHNSNSQFVIIFLRHASNPMVSILRNGLPLARTKFDRRMHSPFNIHLTGASVRASLRACF